LRTGVLKVSQICPLSLFFKLLIGVFTDWILIVLFVVVVLSTFGRGSGADDNFSSSFTVDGLGPPVLGNFEVEVLEGFDILAFEATDTAELNGFEGLDIPEVEEVEGLDIPELEGIEIPVVEGLDIPELEGIEIPEVEGLDIGFDIPQFEGFNTLEVAGLDIAAVEGFSTTQLEDLLLSMTISPRHPS